MGETIVLWTEQRKRLQHFITEEGGSLRNTLRLYILRANLGTATSLDSVTDDLWQDVVVEALRHADRFDTMRQPKAWLLGIASNLIKRRQDDTIKRERREPLVRDMRITQNNIMSDDELFDLLAQAKSDSPAQQIEANDSINTLLAGVSRADQDIIRLAIIHDLNGDMLAQALNIKASTARVRLHRALHRLRQHHNADVNQEVNKS